MEIDISHPQLKGMRSGATNSSTASNSPSVSPPPPAPAAPAAAVAPAPVALNDSATFGGSGISSHEGASQAHIERIMEMGFTEEQVIRALRTSSDNPDHAVELLLNVCGSLLARR